MRRSLCCLVVLVGVLILDLGCAVTSASCAELPKHLEYRCCNVVAAFGFAFIPEYVAIAGDNHDVDLTSFRLDLANFLCSKWLSSARSFDLLIREKRYYVATTPGISQDGVGK